MKKDISNDNTIIQIDAAVTSLFPTTILKIAVHEMLIAIGCKI